MLRLESGFGAGQPLWAGLGKCIKDAPTSADAIKLAGLDWEVEPRNIFDEFGREIPKYKVNVRTSDNTPLGIVTDKYKIVQNAEAFAFTDELLGHGVKYETAGSLASGKRVWMLARMANTTLAEESIDPFLVFTNTHDGSGSVKVAITPVRVICSNTLNLALKKAKRHWTCVHKGNIASKMEEARMTLSSTDKYMKALETEFGELKLKKVSDKQVEEMTERLLQLEFQNLFAQAARKGTDFKDRLRQQKYEDKIEMKRHDILTIYHEKPDLIGTEKSAFRFVNAVSDYATHTDDHKHTQNYQENLFMKTVDGNNLIDTAYQLALAV